MTRSRARPVRLQPGRRARLDRKAGALGVEGHQSARRCPDCACAAAQRAVVDWSAPAPRPPLMRRASKIMRRWSRSCAAGSICADAPQLEADQAEAALAEASPRRGPPAGRADPARPGLPRNFRASPCPSRPRRPRHADLRSRRGVADAPIRSSNAATKSRLPMPRRGALVRSPNAGGRADLDPTVCPGQFSERSGAERGAGPTVTIPDRRHHRASRRRRSRRRPRRRSSRDPLRCAGNGRRRPRARRRGLFGVVRSIRRARRRRRRSPSFAAAGSGCDRSRRRSARERQTHASFRAETIARN